MSNFMKLKKYSATKKIIALRNLLVVTIAFIIILSNLFILKVDAAPEGTRSVVIWTTDSNYYTSIIGTYLSNMSTFYQEKNATASTIFGGHLSSDSLNGVNLLWVFLPNADFTDDDITYMSNFLSTGGRIVFCGENSGIFPQGNIFISGAIAKLGGSFAIINQNHAPGSGIITGENIIGASKLTDGLTGYYYSAATKISYSGSTQVVINGMDDSPMVVDQAVGNGRITLFTDINNWDPVFSNSITQGNSQVLFENLLIDAQANQAIVAAGGNPNVGFGGSPSYVITANAHTFGQASASQYIFRVEYKVAEGSSATFHSQQFDDNGVTVKNASGISFIVHKDTSVGAGTGIVSGEGTNDVVVQYTVMAPDGTWDDIDEGTYTIGIVNAAVEDSDGKQIAGNSAATSFNVTIAQIQTYSVAGTIKYSNNNSVSGAAIILSDTAGSLLTYSGTTDENGNYNITGVPNGSYIITVTENNETLGSSSVTVMDSNVSDANVTVSLPTGITYTVSGTIKYSNNNTVSGAAIVLINKADSSKTYSTLSDTNGNYTITDVPNGSYIITVTENNETLGSGSVTVMDSNVSDANVTISLPTDITYTVSGTIKYSNNNTVSGAVIALINKADSTKTYSALSDTNGNYTITGVPNGSYIITVTENNETLGSSSVTVMDSNVSDANVTISLPTGITYTVSGTIKYSNNNTVSGAVIALINKADSTKTYSALSDTNGNYTITGVPNGSYIITVTENNETLGSSSVTVMDSNVSDANVTISLPTDITYTVSGTIKYSNNNTVSGAVIALINKADSTKTYSALSDTDGNYTITGVQDGRYVIIVTKGRSYGSGIVTVNGSDVTDGSGNVTITTSTSTPTSTPVTPTTQIAEITADIKIDDSQVIASMVTILRKTEIDGSKTDTVIYQDDKAKETIEKLLKEGKNVARIVIPDEKDEISETNVRIPTSTLNLFAASNISLEIDTENARISIPKESIQNVSNVSTEELFFHIIPIKKEEEKVKVIERAKLETVIIDAIKGSAISVIGRPMTIDTNMTSTAVDITLPLNEVVIPTNAKAREEFLSKLAIYIEHSDGEKELVRGEIVEYKDGVLGIKFRITKFSIFTIVKADNLLQKSNACKLVNVISPSDTALKGTKLSLTVKNKTTKVKLNVTVSKNATWKLYSDAACKKEISNKYVKLKVGKNKAYIKVTAEDGTSAKVYTMTVTRSKKVVTKKVIFVATNADFADAYAGKVLAKQLGGKVISFGYSEKEVQKIVNYVNKNLTTKDTIYIFGLEQAVKNDVGKILEEKGYKNIIRIGGKDKYETAQKISESMKPKKGTKVVLVNGDKMPTDGENINKVCVEQGYPILFVKADRLTKYTIAALKEIKPSKIYVVGDKTQISDKAVKELKRELDVKDSNIIRIKGSTDISN